MLKKVCTLLSTILAWSGLAGWIWAEFSPNLAQTFLLNPVYNINISQLKIPDITFTQHLINYGKDYKCIMAARIEMKKGNTLCPTLREPLHWHGSAGPGPGSSVEEGSGDDVASDAASVEVTSEAELTLE